MKKKILSLLLAVSLLLSLCSPAAMAASSVTIVIDLTNYAGEVSGKLIGKPIEAQKRNEIVISGTGYVLATTISLGEDITCSWNVEGLDSGYLTYDENSHLSAIKLSPSGTKNVITVVDSKLEVTRTSRSTLMGSRGWNGATVVLTPVFEKGEYSATVNVKDAGKGTAGAFSIGGETYRLAAMGADGYAFDYWLAGESSSPIYENPYTVTLTENTNFTAYFRERRVPTVNAETNGTAAFTYSKPKPLTWWRKLGAALTGAMAFLLFLSFMNITDLTKLITAGGMTELANHQMFLYALFILSLFLFAACITRRSHRKDYVLQVPRTKRKLAKRTIVAAVLILLLIPLTLYIGVFYLGNKKYYFISLMVLLECMLPFFLIFEGRKPQARELVIIAVLCAIGIAGRAAFFMLPQFKPVMALTIVAGVAFGGETGFLVGAMTMLASNVLFGQGPLTPWQMFAMGIIGFLAGLLFRKGLLRRNRGALCVFGALAAILIYGGIMNPASALTWVGELNEKVLLTYYISGLPFDCIQAAATWLFLWFGAEPMLEKLDRIKVKYGMVEV